MKNLIAIVMIALAIGMVFTYAKPLYDGTKDDPEFANITSLQASNAELEGVLETAQKINVKAKALAAERDAMDPVALQKLDKLAPSNVDQIRLMIAVNAIAARFGLKPAGITTADVATVGKSPATGIAFSVTASYQTFLTFLQTLESSLRIYDVDSISFQSTKNGIYTYTLNLKAYWAK